MTTAFKKIMVTLDGSDFAAQALPRALAIAEGNDAELILFRVVPDVTGPAVIHFGDPDREAEPRAEVEQHHLVDEAMESLTELRNELALHALKGVQAVVEAGGAAEKIVDYAAQNEVDLLVMTSHGRTGLARWVYGSVAEKVLRGATCSILLVRTALSA